MTISPIMTIGGTDVSRYVLSVHAEMTANLDKDPGKFDCKIANVGGRFLGSFTVTPEDESSFGEISIGLGDEGATLNPKSIIEFSVRNTKDDCETSTSDIIRIFKGEVQFAEVDENCLEIKGSCYEGGFSSAKKKYDIYEPGYPINQAVEDLLTQAGFTGTRHIFPKKNNFPFHVPDHHEDLDFETAMVELADQAQSIYYFDENDEFWFVPAFTTHGAVNLDGHILRGTSSKNMIGHCNFVVVYGGSVVEIEDPLAVIKSHKRIMGVAYDEEDIEECGLMKAPPLRYPNCPIEECQEIAENLLEWYMQYKDVPQVKVAGLAPFLLTKVSYHPWNNNLPPTNCDTSEAAETQAIIGLVTRRVVDFDASGGFVSTLDIATNGQSLGDAFDMGFLEDPSIDPGTVEEYNPLLEVGDQYLWGGG